jgi:uncharacterized protein YuzE
MIINFKKLTDLLKESGLQQQGASPSLALLIKFGDEKTKSEETKTYSTRDGGIISIDLDDKNNVIGIEVYAEGNPWHKIHEEKTPPPIQL